MDKDYKKLFSYLESEEPANGLFERIILTIQKEQELRQARRLLFGFSFFLFTSLIILPVSGIILASQIKNSGILYFISTAISDFSIFLVLWKDFGLAILESLPLTGILIFALSLCAPVFTFRLIIQRRKLL